MPDLDSFIVTAKNQENLSAGVKRKRTKKDRESLEEEVMPTGGTASRRGKRANDKVEEKTERSSKRGGEFEMAVGLEPKIMYPNKKFNVSVALCH